MSKSMFRQVQPTYDAPIYVPAKCGQPGCVYDARVRVWRNSGGYTDVCKPCYDKLFQTYAHKWCVERGLDNKDKLIAYCKRIGRSLNLNVGA